MEWLHKFTCILGRGIVFMPNQESIDCMDPNNTAMHHAHGPVTQAIADNIQAMNNAAKSNMLVTKILLTKTIKDFKDKLDEKLRTLITKINTHTVRRLEATTTMFVHHITHLQTLLWTIAHEFQQSNICIQGIDNGLSATAPDIF